MTPRKHVLDSRNSNEHEDPDLNRARSEIRELFKKARLHEFTLFEADKELMAAATALLKVRPENRAVHPVYAKFIASDERRKIRAYLAYWDLILRRRDEIKAQKQRDTRRPAEDI